MVPFQDEPLITTIGEQCKMCYTCVRECPAKAIRVREGQAEVIYERCIGCGNCVRVCSQEAKKVLDNTTDVQNLLADPSTRTAAIIAPSFPAEFVEYDAETLVSMLRALGFDYVNEVAFGADLVARAYRGLLTNTKETRYIATSCPGIIGFVERFYPEWVPQLAPIVSPMVASARALHQKYGADLSVVFIGPCIAKKGEARSPAVANDVRAALTFGEIRNLFEEQQISPDNMQPSEFDEPRPGLGALFPISRGLLQAADIEEDLLTDQVVATAGRTNFVQAIREFSEEHLDARLLEVLCCDGCIMGAGTTCQDPLFRRRNRVSQYVRRRWSQTDKEKWQQEMDQFENLDLTRSFRPDDQRIPQPPPEELKAIMRQMGKTKVEDELNCGACGYETCYEHAVAIYKGLAESEMCLPYSVEQLKNTVDELADSKEQLENTQEALMHSERLASMGQLAAGVAHEVNNPLGVVLMYAHMLLEEVQDKEEWSEDVKTIVEQADRCKKIVSRLLNFARQNKGVTKETNLVNLIDHTLQAFKTPENISVKVEQTTEDPMAELDPDQIQQVLTNLITNAFDAMPEGGSLTITVTGDNDTVILRLEDTGQGMPEENRAKIFEPFFTTKQIGKGTGLGLSVTHGIIKMHRGKIEVTSNDNPEAGPTGTTFDISLPRKAARE